MSICFKNKHKHTQTLHIGIESRIRWKWPLQQVPYMYIQKRQQHGHLSARLSTRTNSLSDKHAFGQVMFFSSHLRINFIMGAQILSFCFVEEQNICQKWSIELSIIYKRTYNIICHVGEPFMKGISYSLGRKGNANIHHAFFVTHYPFSIN